MNEQNGLWANIRAKRARGERMRKPGEKGAPTQDALKRSQGEEVSPMIKAPKTKQFADKAAALAHSKSNGGKVYKSTFINPRTGIKDISYVVKEEAVGLDEMTTTADAGIPQDTKNMGPRLKSTVMHDRRRRKDSIPVLLKRFRKYIEDKNIG